jgi:colicin import membrane protein
MFASLSSMLASSFVWRIAIICIALSAGFTRAQDQNQAENALPKPASAEQMERQRIAQERSSLKAQLEQQRQACYQKFAVSACLNDARDQHNEKMRDLKRQEVSLNDVQRKRAGADRLRAIEERNSPEAQLKQSQERGKALENSAKREQQRQEREASRLSKRNSLSTEPAAPAIAESAKPEAKSAAANPAPQAALPSPSKSAAEVAQMERKRQQAAKREKDAQERRARMQEREAKRKKPASAPLPAPAS